MQFYSAKLSPGRMQNEIKVIQMLAFPNYMFVKSDYSYVVIQFPSGVVPSAEMAGFTPCMGIYWSEIFLQGACPCLPPTSVF